MVKQEEEAGGEGDDRKRSDEQDWKWDVQSDKNDINVIVEVLEIWNIRRQTNWQTCSKMKEPSTKKQMEVHIWRKLRISMEMKGARIAYFEVLEGKEHPPKEEMLLKSSFQHSPSNMMLYKICVLRSPTSVRAFH